ncbi:chemotaxis protein CheW [Undibacterium luofuense]|uniref:chemotaxis protein CheW n=1 Tax=Undibacterium luofuense TaxID=2828733 RepID=UPI0030EC8120
MGALTETTARSTSPVPQEARKRDSSAQYLTFMLSGEVFSIPILPIREIIQYGELTEVPMMPSFIRGVINLRGKVVPVIDLNARFGRDLTAVARRTSIIIIEMTDKEDVSVQAMGVMVDAVNEVVDIADADIEPPPSFGARIRPDFIGGMAKHQGRFMVLLDLTQVLSVAEMTSLGQSLTGVAATQEQEYER